MNKTIKTIAASILAATLTSCTPEIRDTTMVPLDNYKEKTLDYILLSEAVVAEPRTFGPMSTFDMRNKGQDHIPTTGKVYLPGKPGRTPQRRKVASYDRKAAERPTSEQFAAMEAIFVTLASVVVLSYALLAAHLRAQISRPGTLAWLSRGGGVALIGLGAATALAKRA